MSEMVKVGDKIKAYDYDSKIVRDAIVSRIATNGIRANMDIRGIVALKYEKDGIWYY